MRNGVWVHGIKIYLHIHIIRKNAHISAKDLMNELNIKNIDRAHATLQLSKDYQEIRQVFSGCNGAMGLG